MRFQSEYLLKGVYLGLVLMAALHLAAVPRADTATWQQGLLALNLAALAGLGAGLFLAALAKFREGLRVRGRVLAFVLFLLLESPTLVYLGILGGTAVGLYRLRTSLAGVLDADRVAALEGMWITVVGGAGAAGLIFGLLKDVRDRLTRVLVILAAAAGLVAFGANALGLAEIPYLSGTARYDLANPTAFAIQVLLGIPFFYLLTFSGHEEESEVEIGVIAGLLATGLGILLADVRQAASLAFLLPVVLYFGYTLRVLPGLRVLKHAFRGLSYTRVGKHRRALLAFRRALQLEPNNHLAREGFWEVHRSLDLNTLADDPQTLSLVDLDLCLDRAGTLLLLKPSPKQLDEANRLLALVLKIAPDRRPQVTYWNAVAAAHAGNLDAAAEALAAILDPEHFGGDSASRRSVLLPAWLLALVHHPGLRRLVGEPQLAQPGRRMEAIYAVEREKHFQGALDATAEAFRQALYAELDEAEYDRGAGAEDIAAPFVDHDYLQQLGLRLINDDERWHRGGEYLRLAARGLPDLGPALFVQIAQAQQRAGLIDEARHNFELAKRAGQGVGQQSLADAQRQAYFVAVKFLADDARERGDLREAIENFRLYNESERAGLETLRTLAGLYEQAGDPLAAARTTDQALQYNAKDADLLDRKDRYYYSILPDDLTRRVEQFRNGFDVAYCLQRARQILERYTDLEWLDVASHLTQLVLIVNPASVQAKSMLARVQLRLGERDRALSLLEEARGPQRPDKFASGDDEEAWYEACKQLADLYLEANRADLAVACLNDYRKSPKSGARTLFRLGQAHEMLGETAKAKRFYEQVTAYEQNPLAPEAHDALARLRG